MEGWEEHYSSYGDALEAVYGGRCEHEIFGVGHRTCDCEMKDEEPSEPHARAFARTSCCRYIDGVLEQRALRGLRHGGLRRQMRARDLRRGPPVVGVQLQGHGRRHVRAPHARTSFLCNLPTPFSTPIAPRLRPARQAQALRAHRRGRCRRYQASQARVAQAQVQGETSRCARPTVKTSSSK